MDFVTCPVGLVTSRAREVKDAEDYAVILLRAPGFLLLRLWTDA